jgi:hypothetical protein
MSIEQPTTQVIKIASFSSNNTNNTNETQDQNKTDDDLKGADVTSLPTDNPHTRQRTIWVKAENYFKYVNIALIRKWKIERNIPNVIDVQISINRVLIKPSEKTDQHFIFDFPTLRSRWFDLLGNTTTECDLLALEDLCMLKQLEAIGHYAQVPKEMLRGSLFTNELEIVFVPIMKERTRGIPKNTKLEVIEEYFISDIHKKTYS